MASRAGARARPKGTRTNSKPPRTAVQSVVRAARRPTSRPGRETFAALWEAMRPREWIKNMLVFAGLLFSDQLGNGGAVVDATITFIAFCAMASAGYLLNDLYDAELDRRHPGKRARPIASGALPSDMATVAGIFLAGNALAGSAILVSPGVGGIVAAYGVITAAYSMLLKHLVIVDVMTIAGLFILRVVAGAVAVGAGASEWLLLCTAMLALFLGFTKRRQEAISESHSGRSSRPVLEHYSVPFLDQMVAMVTAGAVISYAIYAVNSPKVGSEMLATGPPVLYAIFRYLYLIYDREDTRSTAEILTRDPGMIVAALVWAATAIVLLSV
jgi:4-hydroxybenzoate polyprenyltransferase